MQVEVQVQSLGQDRSKQPVVLLKEVGGTRLLPIWIGHAEASAIAIHLSGVPVSRPLTHDLLAEMIQRMGGRLHRVKISHVTANTFFAELQIEKDGELIRVDARPSDSIALAIRCSVGIYAEEELLDQIHVELEDSDGSGSAPALVVPGPWGSSAPKPSSGSGLTGEPTELGEPPESGAEGQPGEGSRGLTPRELENYLRTLDPEDFGRFKP